MTASTDSSVAEIGTPSQLPTGGEEGGAGSQENSRTPQGEGALQAPGHFDRSEWLAWRRGGIGASDVAAVLGLSPWSSPWSIWADKVGLVPDDDQFDNDDDPKEFGRRAEAMLGPWFTDRTGFHIVGEQMRVTNPERPWMLATPDGAVADSPDTPIGDVLGGLEIKTDWGVPWIEIPAHYQTQGQWQMAATGWERVWFATLHGRRFRVYELERDQDDIDFMVERVEAFWTGHVLTGEPPPLDGHAATLAAIEAIYPAHVPKSTVEIDDVAGAVAMLTEAKAAKKAASDAVGAATAVLKWAIADNYEGTVNGQRAVTLGTQTRKTTCEHCGEVDESDPFRVLRIPKNTGG